MPRPTRLHLPGGLYHVILRGNHRQPIFLAPSDRTMLDDLVAESLARFGARVHAYCWMTNHVHLAVQVADGLFAAYLEADGTKRDEARRALTEAMRAVWEAGVSADELAAAKAFARTDFLRANETKSRRAAAFGELEALGLGAERFPRLFEDMNALSLEEMNAFIREWLVPEKSWLVIVGPK